MVSPKPTPTNDLHDEYQRSISQHNVPRSKQSTYTQKKDRNSKIVTAQGLRDRRVRLSVEISRPFFDLQDSLGFDKASKALDWLLTKSESAIKDLQSKQFCEDSSTSHHPYCSSEADPAATLKELRAKARARARERTAQKNGIRKLSNIVNPDSESEPYGLLHPRNSCKTCESQLLCFCQLNGIADTKETFENFGVITNKMKPSTVTTDNLQEMNSCTLTLMKFSGDLHDVFGGIQQ